MTPSISVVIPVFNMAQHLRAALDSVLAQTLREIEIICVDDGSTDSSPEILREYAKLDSRIHVITQENAGVGPARNAGIRAARGEFVAFLDPDDFLPDDAVYEVLYELAREKRVRVCGGSVCSFALDGKTYFPAASWGNCVDQAFPRDGLMRFSDWQFDYGFYRYIFEREMLLGNEIFFPPYTRYQDPVFCARALEIAGTFYALRRATYVYRDWHTPDYTNPRRVCDQLRGLRDELKLSRERGYAKLHWLQISRLFEEFKTHIPPPSEKQQTPEHDDSDEAERACVRDVLKEIDGLVSFPLAWEYKPNYAFRSVREEFLIQDCFPDVPDEPFPQDTVDCVFITDDGYVRMTAVAINSLRRSRAPETKIRAHIIAAALSDYSEKLFKLFEEKDFSIEILRVEKSVLEKLSTLHEYEKKDNHCMATPAALLKFSLAEILPGLNRVLYLDGDTLILRDLKELFQTPLGENFAAAVTDAWALTSHAPRVKKFGKWQFNSGMMLLNLALMRKCEMDNVLLEAKRKSTDFRLMDQTIFNENFAGRVRLLNWRYNFLPVWYYQGMSTYLRSLEFPKRALATWGVEISSAEELLKADITVAHFAGTQKPWNTPGIPFAQEWLDIAEEFDEMRKREFIATGAAPKVSVIIPVYNTGKYLRECLESVVCQTLREIEIICVNDGSTDSSPQILAEYATKDPRFVVISQENLGTSQTRKNGVLASKGEFVMFLDGDDEFAPTACEIASNSIVKNQADIVQFGTEIINIAGVPEKRIAANEKMLQPFQGSVEHENLVSAVWEKGIFSGNLWNKIFRGELIRKAFCEIEDGVFLRAEDWYAFFIIAYFANSCVGIPEKLYRYKFGIGIIGGNSFSQKKFEAVLSQKKVWDRLNSFISDKPDVAKYQSSLNKIREIFLGQCIDTWAGMPEDGDAATAFSRITKTWGLEDVLLSLAENNWDTYCKIPERIFGDVFKYKPEENKKPTIALYYRCIASGGAQRVVADLCNLFSSKKNENGETLFNVVCITDNEFFGPQEEYPLSYNVKRAYLPAFAKSARGEYRERFRAWHKIISELKIDIVVSGLWTEPATFWDALCVKGHSRHPAFLVHSHNYNAIPYLSGENSPIRIDALYRLCDGVVALSDCDKRHIEKLNPHVRTIVNPLAFDPSKISESSREKNAIAWVGRISPEKRPLDVVKMMAKVVSEIPDAKLYFVGGGFEYSTRKTIELIHELGLAKNIEVVGFTLNVGEFYSKASVFVSPAEFEGFPLTFAEAMVHAVPIVSYDMPWLTFMRDGRGIVPVERFNHDALANEVIRLLKNPDEARALGRLGREQIGEIKKIDIVEDWKNLFDEINGVSVNKKDLSQEECAQIDAINEKFIEEFRQIREMRKNPQKASAPVSAKTPAKKLPAFLVRLGAMFIANKSARKRFRARHLDLRPRDGIDVNAHPELREDSALKAFAVRLAAFFIFSKKKRKDFRARHLNLRPRDGVDWRALSPQDRARRKAKTRERNPISRILDTIFPASRAKIAHTERHILENSDRQTERIFAELNRVRDNAAWHASETRKAVNALREELSRSRECVESLSHELAQTREELLVKTLAVKRIVESQKRGK